MSSRLIPIAELRPKIESALANIAKWREDRYQKELEKTIQEVEADRHRKAKLTLGLYKFRECTREEADKILDTPGFLPGRTSTSTCRCLKPSPNWRVCCRSVTSPTKKIGSMSAPATLAS